MQSTPATQVAPQIKFGTDGWRAVIADTFTVDNVKRVAYATAQWLKTQSDNPSLVLGHDCRFGGKLFAETTAQVMGLNGIKVFLAEGFVSTPMVSLGAKKLNASGGVIITASHNPPSYNGYKLKGYYGGPALPEMIAEVEALVPAVVTDELPTTDQMKQAGLLEYVDLETMYVEHAESVFDMDAIRNSAIKIGYDAMYGAGMRVLPRLLPDAALLHCDYNPSFMGQAPEPILKNLGEFSELIKRSEIQIGLATDGDADRIGLLNQDGDFVDSHNIILLLINYLHKHKGMSGSVVTSFSCTSKIGEMCKQFNLKHIVTKIGFKHICGHIIDGDVLVGGEESGGIAIADHIPERDGIWIGLALFEYMAKTGKNLDQLIQEVHEIVGPFAVERYDLHMAEETKLAIVENCRNNAYSAFGDYKVASIETVDGFKHHLENGGWVMIRPSGTEPVLRCYAEAPSRDQAIAVLEATKATILA